MQYVQSSDSEAQLKVTEYTKEALRIDTKKCAVMSLRKIFITKDLQ